MNFTVILFSIILTCIIIYYIVKNHYVSKLTKAMKTKKYQSVIQISAQPMVTRFVGAYNCDLYCIRATSYLKDDQHFKKVLDNALEKEYPYDQKKNLLEMYFHYFLLKDNKEYATDMLHKIQKFGEPQFSAFSEQAYEVMIEKKSNFIDVMDTEINSKQFSGFTLGVLVYLIGMQYLYLEDKEEARTYFYNSLSCFHPAAVYVPFAKRHVSSLSDELGLEKPKY